jgi:hypothetical protein
LYTIVLGELGEVGGIRSFIRWIRRLSLFKKNDGGSPNKSVGEEEIRGGKWITFHHHNTWNGTKSHTSVTELGCVSHSFLLKITHRKAGRALLHKESGLRAHTIKLETLIFS